MTTAHRSSFTQAGPASTMDAARTGARVRVEHGAIRTLLDDVERSASLALDGAATTLARLRRAVWQLYLLFDEHLAMEEAHVAPLLRASGPDGEARAVGMILEHNEQRRRILELVEDAERDEMPAMALIAEASSLVTTFRGDMEIEESSLASVFESKLQG
jgi:hemerythrin-like domain-containing protein